VLEEGAAIAGIIVLLPTTNYLLLDNIAVSPARQGLGLGRRLLAFAEAEALRPAAIAKSGSTRIKRWWRTNASTLQSVTKRWDAAPRPATTASSCASSFADDRCIGPPNLIAAKITDWSIPNALCREQPRHRQELAGPGRRFR
jgi:hypothetical protein